MAASALFHLAFPVHDLASARHFYGNVIGCAEGRSADSWVDFDFYGHQLVAHLAPDECAVGANGADGEDSADGTATSAVDGHQVPVRHFGAILALAEWQALADRLRDAGIDFVIEPHIRFPGQPGEQATMFFLDASGNALEFKAFADLTQVFAK